MRCAMLKPGTGFVSSVLNAFISTYVRCASSPLVSFSLLMGAAKILFDEMIEKDELTWTTMITGYVRKGDPDADRAILDGMTENMGLHGIQ